MDEFYNAQFAAKVRSIVSKMDADEAEMFMRLATYDTLMADIEANRRTLERHTAAVHKRLADTVAKAAVSLVSKGAVDGAKQAAAVVGVVSKGSTPYEELYHREQPRGKGGRWSVSISREKQGKTPKGKKYQRGNVMVGPEFNLTSALAETGGRTTAFQDSWNKSDPLYASTNKRTYDRIAAGSQALHGVGGPKMQAATGVAGFFGKYGPEAEKVVGPHLRRTAYRYRGTERTPDSALIQAANTNSKNLMRYDETDELTPAMRTHASQRAAAGYLMERLPKKKWTKLQQASGKIPPSEGVIINADGKIITQAVGYADDHYLPFNLKNLKGLQGGHYVRSRSQGGLTTEDIYTGLVSGARSVTVVSRSGIFTINFEDDFRGGRRYNDKAAQMVSRYASTLDAVKSETVSRRSLSPEERAEIRDQVEGEYAGFGMPSTELEDLIKEREDEYKSRPTLTKAELADIDARARKDNDDDERKYKIARSELISAALDKKAQRNYRLDGEGYAASMEALREQFPYYIANVEYKHRDPEHGTVEDPFTNETDKGYVKPRYIRPEGAKEGYFDDTITGRKKISADRLNYANWANNPERAHAGGARLTPVEQENAEDAKNPLAREAKLREQIAQGQAQTRGNESLQKLAKLYQSNFDELPPIITRAAGDDFDSIANNATKRQELMDELNNVQTKIEGDPKHADVHEKARALFVAVEAMRGGSMYDEAKAAENPKTPFAFDSDKGRRVGYSGAANAPEIEAEWRRVAPGALFNVQPGDKTQEELGKLAAMYGYMGHALRQGLDESFAAKAAGYGATAEQIRSVMSVANRGGSEAEKRAKAILKQSEALHRLRRLQANLDNLDSASSQASGKDLAVRSKQPQETPAQTSQLGNTNFNPTVSDVLGVAQSKFREAAGAAAKGGNKDVAGVYNVIARALGDHKSGALDKAMMNRDIQDALDELKPTDATLVRGHLKQLGVDPDED